MHARLPEEDEEESPHQSTILLAQAVDDREGWTRKERRITKLKYYVVTGLTFALIATLFYYSYRDIRIIQATSLKSTQVNQKIDTNPLNSVNTELKLHAEADSQFENGEVKAKTLKVKDLEVKKGYQEQMKENDRLNSLNSVASLEFKKQTNRQGLIDKVNNQNSYLQLKQEQPVLSQTNQESQNNEIRTSTEEQIMNSQKDSNMINAETRQEFIVPPFVWIYSQDNERMSFFVSKCLDNIKYFAGKSSFQLKVINSQNYKNFLQIETAQKIDRVLSILKDRIVRQPYSSLKDHYQTIKKRLISFHVLSEKGGIFVEKNVLFTQSFEWLKLIEDNMYVNKGRSRVKAKYFGFFNPDHGSLLEKHNKTGFNYETEKYMVQFPVVQPYFFAAQANQEFLSETLEEYISILTSERTFNQNIGDDRFILNVVQATDIYKGIFQICQQLALRKKQQQIDGLGLNQFDNTFAIDYYGLLTMNERYFPKKLDFFFERHNQEQIYWNLAKYTLQEMQDTTGPMRYIVCMTLEEHINYRLEKASRNEKKYNIHPSSFLGRFVINNNSQPYILRQFEKGTENPQGRIWESLPRIIWFYWDKGLNSSSIGNKLCVDNIRRAAKDLFQIRELNDSNSAEYLGAELNDRINNYIKNSKIETYSQTKSDFLRIAIIAKYGGIYMDASYFSVGGLEWIVNITKAPSETVFNRYGELPRVLMFFHPHYGSAFDWTYDKQANTKRLLLSAYENNLLIAEPNQELFWDWLAEFGKFVTTPYEQTEKLMGRLGVLGYRWTKRDDMYLAAMDSLKNVIAKKNKEIEGKLLYIPNYDGPKSAAESYGIWSISGYRGQQKFRAHTNFDNTFNSRSNDQNVFLWRYSEVYVNGVIGKANHLVKLYSWNIKQFNKFFIQEYQSNFSNIHPLSYLAKYLYDPQRHKFEKKEDKSLNNI